MLELTPWSLPPLLAAMVCGAIFFRLRQNDHVPGVNALLLLLLAIAFTSICQAIALCLTNETMQGLVVRMSYLGVLIAPLAWFSFCLAYSRRQLHISRIILNIICILPLVTLLLSITNDWHHWLLLPGSVGDLLIPGP